MDVALENAPWGLPKVQRAHSAEMQRQSLRQKDRVNKLDRAPARAEIGPSVPDGPFFRLALSTLVRAIPQRVWLFCLPQHKKGYVSYGNGSTG